MLLEVFEGDASTATTTDSTCFRCRRRRRTATTADSTCSACFRCRHRRTATTTDSTCSACFRCRRRAEAACTWRAARQLLRQWNRVNHGRRSRRRGPATDLWHKTDPNWSASTRNPRWHGGHRATCSRSVDNVPASPANNAPASPANPAASNRRVEFFQ
jgi:hypothetical protein